MKIAIGCDHAGFPYKDEIKSMLSEGGHEVIDMGTNSPHSVDYPDFVHPVASAIENRDVDFGVLICGSGNGVAMTANKHQGVRAAICWQLELARLARQHNDANAIAIPARFIALPLAIDMVKTFIQTPFEAGRHARRVSKISQGC